MQAASAAVSIINSAAAIKAYVAPAVLGSRHRSMPLVHKHTDVGLTAAARTTVLVKS